MFVWLVATLAVGSGAVGAVIYARRRREAARVAEIEYATWVADLEASAEPALAKYRAWHQEVDDTIAQALVDGRWIARETVRSLVDSRPQVIDAARRLAGGNSALAAEARDLIGHLEADLPATIRETNELILAEELTAQREFFDSIESQPLTDEQATAVVTFDNRVLVVAAAGSGKTSVMVARAAYAIKRRFVPADRVLLLAFNKAAATELQDRIENRLTTAGIDFRGLQAATFHSFGMKVIGRALNRKKRLAPWLEGGGDLRMVEQIVDHLRDTSTNFRFKWDLYRLLFGGRPSTPDSGSPDGYDYTTSKRGFKTFSGEIVKSEGERLIADFLFTAGITYEYEKKYVHDVTDAEHSQYRPDFYYPDADVWHEHWALDQDGKPPASFKGYADDMRWKKELHRERGTKLIETTWADIVDRDGFQPFTDQLRAHRLSINWDPDRPKPGSQAMKHEDLARLVRQFMAHVKSNSLGPADLEVRLDRAPNTVPRYRARLFLDLYWSIHDEWQRRLADDDSIDFEDMLVEAATYLEQDRVDMGYDLILVDEIQDASQARARLVRALANKPNRYVLAVGDDWQSINRFAGADLSVMTAFDHEVGEGPTLRLETSFRSTQSIIDTAASFVTKNPHQLKKSVKSFDPGYGAPAALVLVRKVEEKASALTRVIDDLAARVRDGRAVAGPTGRVTVFVLGRYRFDKDLLPRRIPPELVLTFQTVHSSKGLEADYVILPNVTGGTYGFPSQIADDPVMALAMPAPDYFEHAEERRLMYVALTRARRHVTLISVRGQESPFVAELLRDQCLEHSPLSTAEIIEGCPQCDSGTLIVRWNRATGTKFRACTAFPACNYTAPLPTSLETSASEQDVRTELGSSSWDSASRPDESPRPAPNKHREPVARPADSSETQVRPRTIAPSQAGRIDYCVRCGSLLHGTKDCPTNF